MSESFNRALAAYHADGRPPLCPRCGGWDGPDLPFCSDGKWTHDQTCRVYSFTDDVCTDCLAVVAEDKP